MWLEAKLEATSDEPQPREKPQRKSPVIFNTAKVTTLRTGLKENTRDVKEITETTGDTESGSEGCVVVRRQRLFPIVMWHRGFGRERLCDEETHGKYSGVVGIYCVTYFETAQGTTVLGAGSHNSSLCWSPCNPSNDARPPLLRCARASVICIHVSVRRTENPTQMLQAS